MRTLTARAAGDAACATNNKFRPFSPFVALKSIGQPLFRTQQARDYACLIDLDPEVVSWRAMPGAILDGCGMRGWHVDLLVETSTEALVVEVCTMDQEIPEWLPGTVASMGYRYSAVSAADLPPVRLQNARDLFAYAGTKPPLGDRIRILATLDEAGTLTLAETLSAVREGRPMHVVAAMILSGLLHVDLDDSLLGPDTVVRRAPK